MEALLSRYRHLTVLLVVILAQLLLLAYQVKTSQDVRLIRVWAVTAVTPLARVLEFVRRNTIGIAEDYFVLVNVREENRKLSDENGRLKLENHYLKSELQTAERARVLSAFQERTPSKTLPARIIGNATGTNARVVFVDRGSTNGVMRGMAVITPDGIVGKVLASYPTASQVQLITDGTFAAGVISQKNRVHGTLKGTGQSKCIIDYVQNEEKVEPGEMFYTSGEDRVFPKGMPVGAATVVRQGKSFKEIYIVPAAFQHGPEEVLIVLDGVHQAIPERVETQSSQVAILPPPPAEGTAPAAADLRSGLTTEADRIRERYKQLGAAQNHVFGEGLPGSRPPDFNLKLDKPQAPANTPAPAAGQPAPAGAKPPAGTPSPAAGQPATAGTAPPQETPAQSGVPAAKPPVTAAAKPAPAQTGTQTPPAQVVTQAPKPQAPKPVVSTAVAKPEASKPPATPPSTPPDGTRNREDQAKPPRPRPDSRSAEGLPFP